MNKNTFTIIASILMLFFTTNPLASQCVTCEACENLVETPITQGFAFPFDAGDGLSFGGDGFFGLLTGANNSFAGAGLGVDAAVAGFALDELCLTGDFTITATNPIDYPLTIEFRIENGNCGFFPCPWVDFFTTVNADGTYTLGGNLSGANLGGNGAFDPAGANPTIVNSIVNFTGTPLAGDVTVTYENIALVGAVCEPIMGCVPTVGEWGLICLTIVFLTFGLVFLRTRSFALQLD